MVGRKSGSKETEAQHSIAWLVLRFSKRGEVVKFGVLYAFRNPPQWHQPYPDFYRAQFDQMQVVEQLGYDVIWVTENHFIDAGYLPSLPPVAA